MNKVKSELGIFKVYDKEEVEKELKQVNTRMKSLESQIQRLTSEISKIHDTCPNLN